MKSNHSLWSNKDIIHSTIMLSKCFQNMIIPHFGRSLSTAPTQERTCLDLNYFLKAQNHDIRNERFLNGKDPSGNVYRFIRLYSSNIPCSCKELNRLYFCKGVLKFGHFFSEIVSHFRWNYWLAMLSKYDVNGVLLEVVAKRVNEVPLYIHHLVRDFTQKALFIVSWYFRYCRVGSCILSGDVVSLFHPELLQHSDYRFLFINKCDCFFSNFLAKKLLKIESDMLKLALQHCESNLWLSYISSIKRI